MAELANAQLNHYIYIIIVGAPELPIPVHLLFFTDCLANVLTLFSAKC
mgnify:CR=1 FL=1